MKSLQNLTLSESRAINGGTEPTNGVYDDGSGNGCTGPNHPFPKPKGLVLINY